MMFFGANEKYFKFRKKFYLFFSCFLSFFFTTTFYDKIFDALAFFIIATKYFIQTAGSTMK